MMYLIGPAFSRWSSSLARGARTTDDVSMTTLPAVVVTRKVLPNPYAREIASLTRTAACWLSPVRSGLSTPICICASATAGANANSTAMRI
jgi:hypothetical protein